MNHILFEPNSKDPLYIQLKNYLLEKIVNGKWNEGEKFPTETDLQNEFKLSRATVRHALSDIEREGYIERHPGKGTVICHKRFKPEIMKVSSFSDDMISRGKIPQSKTVDMKYVTPPPQVREGYGISANDKVWMVLRLRMADGIPIGLQELYIPPKLQISAHDLQQMQSYYQLLQEKHNLFPAFGTEILTAKSADDQEASYLDISNGDPLIYIWRVTYATDESVIEVVKIYYVAERYEYHIQLYV